MTECNQRAGVQDWNTPPLPGTPTQLPIPPALKPSREEPPAGSPVATGRHPASARYWKVKSRIHWKRGEGIGDSTPCGSTPTAKHSSTPQQPQNHSPKTQTALQPVNCTHFNTSNPTTNRTTGKNHSSPAPYPSGTPSRRTLFPA